MQLGAFRERDGAFDFQRKVERDVDWLAPMMRVLADRELYRLQAGPYASRTDAAGAALSHSRNAPDFSGMLTRMEGLGLEEAGDVVVIRYEGPQGGPGMREMLSPTSAIMGRSARVG